MQVGKFSTGQYYAHKVRLQDSPMVFSVWYNLDGTVSDACARDSRERQRPVTAKQRHALSLKFGLIKAYFEGSGTIYAD